MSVNKTFEAYKIAREIKRSGGSYTFFRYMLNNFDEPTDEIEKIATISGLYHEYHEQTSNIEITTGDTTQIRTTKIPMILCLYEDISDLQIGDIVTINSKNYKLTGIVNIQEWNIIGDISLEVIDDGTRSDI